MEITRNSIIGELVARDYRTASVFQSYGIDFCCRGDRSIEEICESRDIELTVLMEELEQVLQLQTQTEPDFNSWPPDLLADYIEKKHHRYVEARIPEIKSYLSKIVQVHGAAHAELAVIEKLFARSAADLTLHMKKEELILFPYIRRMVLAEREGQRPQAPHFGSVEQPVAMMKHEHDAEGERFRAIAGLSNGYTPPADACATYRATLALLQEFEADLYRHIHLENNILFPKALKMEKEQHETAHRDTGKTHL
ncbi:MAG: iron-sulfur cluster repair di-iron protein [Bacteroidia bacterium]|nr:iron-sulfur cluster repair di-iron protein [Bacteroidia bacterium]